MNNSTSNGTKIILQVGFIIVLMAATVAFATYLLSLKRVTTSQTVQLHVEASGGFSIITLRAGSVSISKPTTVTTPWNRTLKIPSGTEVYLTASNPTQTGALTCSISMDNQVWKKETTNAPKDGVACAGIIP